MDTSGQVGTCRDTRGQVATFGKNQGTSTDLRGEVGQDISSELFTC